MATETKNYKVNFKLIDKDDNEVDGVHSVIVPGSKFIVSDDKAKQRVNWHARSLGFKEAKFTSASPTEQEAPRLTPVSQAPKKPVAAKKAAAKGGNGAAKKGTKKAGKKAAAKTAPAEATA